jgi:hypothetical protein
MSSFTGDLLKPSNRLHEVLTFALEQANGASFSEFMLHRKKNLHRCFGLL